MFLPVYLLFSVSRRFYRLSKDRSLWRRVNFSQNHRFNLQKMKQFLRTPMAVHINSLKIEGYLRGACHFSSNRNSVSDNFLEILAEKCPQLR